MNIEVSRKQLHCFVVALCNDGYEGMNKSKKKGTWFAKKGQKKGNGFTVGSPDRTADGCSSKKELTDCKERR